MRYPEPIDTLIAKLKLLPGVGQRSAERFAFHLLEMSPKKTEELAQAIATIHGKLSPCSSCGALSEEAECSICQNPTRSRKKLCIVSHFKEIYPIEMTGEWKGLYHVLGGLLSPLDRIGPDQLNIKTLFRRIEEEGVEELLLALDATLEGDATALYLKRELERFPVTLSRPAFGLPVGSALDLIDTGTLSKALVGRRAF